MSWETGSGPTTAHKIECSFDRMNDLARKVLWVDSRNRVDAPSLAGTLDVGRALLSDGLPEGPK